jgi:hypothetical protein
VRERVGVDVVSAHHPRTLLLLEELRDEPLAEVRPPVLLAGCLGLANRTLQDMDSRSSWALRGAMLQWLGPYRDAKRRGRPLLLMGPRLMSSGVHAENACLCVTAGHEPAATRRRRRA